MLMREFGYKKKNTCAEQKQEFGFKTVLVDPNTLTLCCQSTQHSQKVLPLNPNEPMKQNNNL